VLSAFSAVTPMALAGTGQLAANDYLFPGQFVSQGCYYSLFMQDDGNLVAHRPDGSVVWASNTVASGGYAVMQEDGNFVVYNWSDQWGGFDTATPNAQPGTTVCDAYQWQHSSVSNPDLLLYTCVASHWVPWPGAHNFLWMQNDGNLVVYFSKDATNTAMQYAGWDSRTAGPYLTHSPCSPGDLKTHVDRGMNRQGSDYRQVSIPVQRPSWCGYHCSQDRSCKAYTYVPDGAGGKCWLKNAVPPLSTFAGAVSGVVIGR